MSKARGQSMTRKAKRLTNLVPKSTKLTKSGRTLSATIRTKKYSENLTK